MTDAGDIAICAAQPADSEEILALLPRLASFDVPNNRNPEHLWSSDAVILQEWAAGNRDDCTVTKATGSDGAILGVAMVTLREELLAHSASAHLEVLVVSAAAEGCGVGKALLASAEADARGKGALSMSLHVFATNGRARQVYRKCGYDGELLRYIKPFTKDALR